MRTILLTACLTLGGPGSIGAVAQSGQPGAVAVTIDVIVLDRNGRSVADLSPADFTVELDGRAQRILAATYLAAGAPMAGGVGPVFDAVTPGSPVYRILVEPPDGTSPGKEFTVGVVVTRPNTRVQADARTVAAPDTTRGARPSPSASPATSVEERLRRAIASGRPERGLPISFGRTLRRGGDPAQVTLDVAIDIGASAQLPLTAVLGVVDPGGAIRSATRTLDVRPDAGPHRIEFSLPLAPGIYKLRFAVADAGGTIGAIESAVKAELAPMGTLLASDLLRWTADAGGQPRPLLLDEIPTGSSSVGSTLELYITDAANVPPDLLVRMTLGPADSRQSPSIERIVTPETRDGVFVADAEFPLQRIASGTYTLRAVVQSGTAVIGSASATVIKR